MHPCHYKHLCWCPEVCHFGCTALLPQLFSSPLLGALVQAVEPQHQVLLCNADITLETLSSEQGQAGNRMLNLTRRSL